MLYFFVNTYFLYYFGCSFFTGYSYVTASTVPSFLLLFRIVLSIQIIFHVFSQWERTLKLRFKAKPNCDCLKYTTDTFLIPWTIGATCLAGSSNLYSFIVYRLVDSSIFGPGGGTTAPSSGVSGEKIT